MAEKYFICTNINNKRILLNGMAVVCHMYYLDTVENYCNYLRFIPQEVALFVVTSNFHIKELLEERLCGYREIEILLKPTNRGRDISSLLIDSKQIVSMYEYLCFIHDKKPIADYLAGDTNLWIENMWKNMLGNVDYLKNIRAFFENNPQCGLLIPPKRFGRYFHDWEYSEWSDGDYIEINKFLKSLDIEVEIDRESEAISLGTTFWCRTRALKRLFNVDWKYDDFPEEPLPNDGAINHAIERSFPYIVERDGYKTYVIVNDEFAPKIFIHSQEYGRNAYQLLLQTFGIRNIADMIHANNLAKKVEERLEYCKGVVLFGAGTEGLYCLRFLRSKGIEPNFFLDSKIAYNRTIEGVEVRDFKLEKNNLDKTIIIITPYSATHKDSITAILNSNGSFEYYYWRELR